MALDTAITILVDSYRKLLARPARARIRRVVRDKTVKASLIAIQRAISRDNATLERMDEQAITSYFELRALQLLFAPPSLQAKELASIEGELSSILKNDTQSARMAGGLLVSCLLLMLEELQPRNVQKVLALLGSLTGRREGIARPQSAKPVSSQISEETALRLSNLLDYGLVGEVYAFVRGMRALQHVTIIPELADFGSVLVSITSRKGGVGKSTLTLAMALGLVPQLRVCILDLDLTGPIWQYLLCPDGTDKRDKPIRFLNRLLNMDQVDEFFDFGAPSHSAVLECIASTAIPAVPHELGLLTFEDLPRTNRYIAQMIANKRESFTQFLVSVLLAVSKEYDCVLIDNGPGLDAHPLVTLVIAATVQHGIPIVVSSPYGPDLRGTVLELSDLGLVPHRHAPYWIVNKADSETYKFFHNKHTLAEIAEKTRGYSAIMPDAPLLLRVLPKRPLTQIIHPLPFDNRLAKPTHLDLARPLTETAVRKFLEGEFFKAFSADIVRSREIKARIGDMV